MMNLTKKELNAMPNQNGFRLRGLETTRLDTFMDAAFAFVTTLLVISVGKIPGNYPELILALKEIPSVAFSFFIIMLFWKNHRSWSRRYGVEDTLTMVISQSLIFVLLVYVYPLRLMFSVLFAWISAGWLPTQFELISYDELIGLFIIYGIGLFTLAGLMALLYLRVKYLADKIKLDKIERIKTDSEITSFAIVSLTGACSALCAWLIPSGYNFFAGFIYILLPVVIPIVKSIYKKKCL